MRPGAYGKGAGFSSVFGVSGTGYLGGYGFWAGVYGFGCACGSWGFSCFSSFDWVWGLAYATVSVGAAACSFV